MTEPRLIIRNPAPLAPIRLGAREGDVQHARAQLILLIYMRVVALIWMAEGMAHWADLLTGSVGQSLAALSSQRITAVFFFCVLDFVAAVGLWLATPWGGVVWLVTVGVQVLALATLPDFWHHGTALVLSDVVLVGAYFYFAWQAGRDSSDA